MSKPQPVVADGTYKINFASLYRAPYSGGALSLGSVQTDVSAKFTTFQNGGSTEKVQQFVITDPQTGKTSYHTYNYSWGNKALNSFIVGDGSGGYYIISSSESKAGQIYANGNDLVDSSKTYYLYSNVGTSDWTHTNYIRLSLNGNIYLFTQDNDGTATSGVLGETGASQFTFNTCFMVGSLIRTPSGYRKVEELCCGDMVLTHDPVHGMLVEKAVTWLGQGTSEADPGLYLEQAGYPVRVKAHALAENVPFEDLLVTSEHCFFLEGAFVPARMLVNGCSIYFDRTIPQFTYYHVETESHSVLFSNGLLSESYLDTGNQETFANHQTRPCEASRNLSWQDDAAAPLRVERSFVEPLHARFLERARQFGLPEQHGFACSGISTDIELFLLSEQDERLPESRSSTRYRRFLVPHDAEHVFLVSRTARPYDVIGPFCDDRRQLGVLVGNITYFWEGYSREIVQHLEDDELEGWHGKEQSVPQRWTRGKACIPLERPRPLGQPGLLAIEIVAGGPYPMRERFMFNRLLPDEHLMAATPQESPPSQAALPAGA